VFKTPTVRGQLGELLVRVRARIWLPAHAYKAFHNVTLPTPTGTTQIDHVFVSAYGVFVIETKHMRGWIFGGEEQVQWTQKFPRKTFRFQNPLRQNYKHVKALEAALGVDPERVHSVVVFTGSASFKTAMPANVTRGGGFVTYIKRFREPVFTQIEVEALALALTQQRLAPTLATHRAHVAHLKQRAKITAARTCPRCGQPMLRRAAKTGAPAGAAFWGCSGFPQCRERQVA
jgi:hypothetical protein